MAAPSGYVATVEIELRPAPEPPNDGFFADHLRHELLARPIVQGAIEELGLFGELVRARGIEAAIAKLRQDLVVLPSGANGVSLKCRADDGAIAVLVVDRLVRRLLEAEEARKAELIATRRALREEVARLSDELSRSERNIARFKANHLGELPGQLETNIRALNQVAARLQDLASELRATEARRKELARATRLLGRRARALRDLHGALGGEDSGGSGDSRLRRRLSRARRDLHETRALLRVRRAEQRRAESTTRELRAALSELRAQQLAYRRRLDRAPLRAMELAALDREHEIAREWYREALARTLQAEAAKRPTIAAGRVTLARVRSASPWAWWR